MTWLADELRARLLTLRVEIAAMERLMRETGANKSHLRYIADLFETTCTLEAELMLEKGEAE